MTNRPDNSDARLSQLAAATSVDAAPPDRAFLAALRERSTAEFVQAGEAVPLTHEQKTTMLFTRALIALVATAAAVLGGIWIQQQRAVGPPAVAELTLGQVMQNLAKTRSYRVQVAGENESYNAMGRASTLRIEHSPSRYTLAQGAATFDVDEAENRATPQDALYYSSEFQAADPFRLIGVPVETVAGAKPTARQTQDGRELFVYFTDSAGEQAAAEILVDAKTHLPHSARRLKADAGGKPDLAQSLQFVAFDEPMEESKLKISATLTEDGRIGKVVESQGVVSLRPMTATRWTPVCGRPILRPGDWLRTDFQGPNAATVQLAPQTTLILGPGSLVELTRPDQITLHSGIAEISASPKADSFSGIVKLTGPAGATMDVGGVALVRASERGLTKIAKDPPWLAGYKGNAVRESLGSLVAEIDGRRVPLTVGYHKVSVEIRDQVARTTIEESFVNHTAGVLQGEFHFPLPADASISGFGMWIGDKLVEADIVEKQRAREIYEEILREKRDPGLLEWTGGNIFKARVYPIPGNGEKRIKIVYTQVLPRQGETYRYSYALQSDLLRQNPLRQLELEVTVASTQPLAGVLSPTHQTRNQLTPHAARVEYSAQNYTPERDFEVVIQTQGQTPDITFIPHQRGSDGYFLLQLQPPAGAGVWQRDVLPDGEPLKLLILADTSASMDASSRQKQAEVLASILGSLSPKDTFNLAVCDVDCLWSFDKSQNADEKSIAAAREYLHKRRSLGWTNLDRAFESVAERVQQGTQVIYLGDGIVTYGDMDGPAFVQRLVQKLGGKGATIHAVAVSSSYDSPVLRGMASIGGGSVRQISGEIGPSETAKNLLAEITRPALRNIRLEFKGLQTARVYPQVLPNVPTGTQQIVLGRYLPEPGDQRGEVIVTGTLNGQRVTYRAAVDLSIEGRGSQESGASDDASFIPRLWARMHLDELLAQGASQEIQDEIINLSEEFHIITPYTSLLVLESDADRERFKVKKRFLMRDGERFFAQGRDAAQYQLVQQQMQRAGLWRVGLRRSVLASLAGLGRDRDEIEAARAVYADFGRLSSSISNIEDFRSMSDRSPTYGGVGGMLGDLDDMTRLKKAEDFGLVFDPFGADPLGRSFATNGPWDSEEMLAADEVTAGAPMEVLGKKMKAQAWAGEEVTFDNDLDGTDLYGWYDVQDAERGRPQSNMPAGGFGFYAGRGFRNVGGRRGDEDRKKLSIFRPRPLSPDAPGYPSDYAARSRGLAPLLPERLPPAPPAPAPRKERKSLWGPRAQELSRGLMASIDLGKLDGALVVEEEHRHFENEGRRLAGRSQLLGLHSAKAWLTRDESDSTGPRINWADPQERGVLNVPYELVLVRKSAPTDFPSVYDPSQYWQSDIEWRYQDRFVQVLPQEDGKFLLILSEPLRPDHQARILIDETRHVVLSLEHFTYGKQQGGTRASDFIEVAGAWLPQKIESYNEHGHVHHVVTRKFTVVTENKLTALTAEQLTPRASALTLKWPLPRLKAAKQRAAGGQATLEDRLVLLVDLAFVQKWPEATAELARCEQLAGGKYFAVWMRAWLLSASRRNEELKLLLLAQAKELAEKARPGEWTLVTRILQESDGAFSAAEQLELLDLLKPVYLRRPEHVAGARLWGERRRLELANAGRGAEEIALLRQLVSDFPEAVGIHVALATRFMEEGEQEAAYGVLTAALVAPGVQWSSEDRLALYRTWRQLLERQGRYGDIATLAADWMKLNPTDTDPYEQYLAALIFTRREAEADQAITAWLEAGLGDIPLDKATATRCEAAIRTVLGDNSYLRGGDFDPKWVPSLIALIEKHLDRDDHPILLSRADDWDVQRTEPYRLLAQRMFARLKDNAGNFAAARLSRLVEWCLSHDGGATDDDWKGIAAAIRRQWEAAVHPTIRESYAYSLLRVLSRIGLEERLAFLRLQLETSDDDHRDGHASALFDALLEAPWTAEIEAESLALIDKLASQADADTRLQVQVAALYRWTDRMDEARYQKLESEIDRPDKLTSKELAEKRKAIRSQVRTDLAARLAIAAKREDGLKKWLLVEQFTLQARQEADLPKIVEGAWELLGPALPAAKVADPTEQPITVAEQLDAAFRSRLVTMLIRLAIRKDASPAEAERLGKYLDQLIAADADGRQLGIDARLARYVLLVALDQPHPLAEKLTAWSQGSDRPQLWKRTLAYLQAELGKLDEAIVLAEGLIAEEAWGAADYRALAGWYQARKLDDKYRTATIAAWKQMDEWRLRDVVSMHLRPWQNSDGPLPTAIDPQVLEVIEALMQKSQEPRQHMYLIRALYEATRDFRLLTGMADAVVGQTAGKIYPYLGELKHTLDEIDREATVDELIAHLAKVRERAATPVDRRALDLLEMLIEKRAAQLQNQPGPHAERAVAALERSLKPEWTAGEPLLLARMLASLGQVLEPQLSAARARAIRQLHGQVQGNPHERLFIAYALAESLSSDNQRQPAIDALDPALSEYFQASGMRYDWSAVESLRLLASLHAQEGRFVRSQQILFDAQSQATNDKVARELTLISYGIDVQALERGGSSTRGSGLRLFRESQKQLIAAALETTDHEFRRRLIETLYRLYRAAKDAKLPETGPDAIAFTQKQLPVRLDRQIDSHQELVNDAARVLRDVASPRDALAFYITRLEVEPSWLARRGERGWQRFAWEMGRLFDEESVRTKLGDLAPRLLAVVLKEQRRDLVTQNYNQRAFYHLGYSHFWQEKTDEFARVAEEVLVEQRDSLRATMYIAEYMYAGIGKHDRGIAVLLDAHRRGLLDLDGRQRLVAWLQERDRFGESISLLEPLVKEHPGVLQYRLQLMHAYFRTKQPEALQTLLATTDKYFHLEDRWNEDVAGQLANSCLENQLLEQAVEYLKEAIGRREEMLGGHLVRDQKLAQYYVDRAYAYAGLKNTTAAAEDAASALVVWGAAGDGIYRRNALTVWRPSGHVHPIDVLKEVLAESPNLDAYVTELDKVVAALQQDRPVVRKAIGEVYAERKAWDKAIVQLKLAVELDPNDGAIHAKLVECYRETGNKAAETSQLFASVELARRDVELWVKLAALLEELKQPAEAERARTSLVEVLPQETEGHQKLAELREKQGQWNEAIAEWRHVARLRKLEPAGLLGLASAQIQQKDRPAAEATLRELERTDWHQRFRNQLRNEQIPKLREALQKL